MNRNMFTQSYVQCVLICVIIAVLPLSKAFIPSKHAYCKSAPSSTLRFDGKQTSSETVSIAYRNLQEKDISSVAELCSGIFDGGEGWRPQSFDYNREESVNGHREVLFQRYRELILREESINSTPSNKRAVTGHVMIVAVDNHNDKVCGFLEVGFLPSPMPVPIKWGGATINQVKDVPYLGNVLVDKLYRRRGIASRLVRIGLKVCEKWKEDVLWLAVDSDNLIAFDMYKKMGFESRVDEREFRPPPLSTSGATSINDVGKVPRIFMSKQVTTI